MLAIGIGISMSVLDSAIANIALPSIAGQLQVTPAESVWVINAYQLVIVVSLLPMASLGDRVGYRLVYQVGLAIFTAGSLACALSHALPTLVVARALQGFGAAGLMSANGALVRFTYPRAMLGRGIGVNALVVSSAAAIGPTLASGILLLGPWQWLFAVNVPVGVLNLVLAARALPRSDRSRRPFDWTSAGLNALAFGLFFVGADTFSRGSSDGWIAVVEVGAAVATGFVLVRREAVRPQPLTPVDLLKIPAFALSVAASICAFAAYMLAFIALPFWLENALHRDQVQTGLLMTAWPAAVAVMAPLAGRLSDRVSAAILGAIGMAALAAGLFLLSMLGSQPSTPDIVWPIALCGLGFGFFQSPNNRTMLSAAPRSRAGAAGGMLATARLTGMTGGAALAALTFRVAGDSAERIDLMIGVALALAAGVVSLARQQK